VGDGRRQIVYLARIDDATENAAIYSCLLSPDATSEIIQALIGGLHLGQREGDCLLLMGCALAHFEGVLFSNT
jgi:hypothetical protein